MCLCRIFLNNFKKVIMISVLLNTIYLCPLKCFFFYLCYSLIPDINLFNLHGKMNNKRYKIFELFCKADKGKY